jgi:hypothetical protein
VRPEVEIRALVRPLKVLQPAALGGLAGHVAVLGATAEPLAMFPRRYGGTRTQAVALGYFAYNFIKIHRTLRTTPAMAAWQIGYGKWVTWLRSGRHTNGERKSPPKKCEGGVIMEPPNKVAAHLLESVGARPTNGDVLT